MLVVPKSKIISKLVLILKIRNKKWLWAYTIPCLYILSSDNRSSSSDKHVAKKSVSSTISSSLLRVCCYSSMRIFIIGQKISLAFREFHVHFMKSYNSVVHSMTCHCLWDITGFLTPVTWRVSLLEQEMPYLPEDISSIPI